MRVLTLLGSPPITFPENMQIALSVWGYLLRVSINYIYFSMRRVEMRMKSVVGLSAFIAVATLALGFFLLPRMGILGAGVSYLIAQAIPASGIGLWLLKRHHEQEV